MCHPTSRSCLGVKTLECVRNCAGSFATTSISLRFAWVFVQNSCSNTLSMWLDNPLDPGSPPHIPVVEVATSRYRSLPSERICGNSDFGLAADDGRNM